MQSEWFNDPEHDSFDFPGDRGGAMLLHGFMGTPREMRPLGLVMNELGYAAHGPLLPGFGRQINTIDSVGCEEWIGHAGHLWAELYKAGRANVLIGYSMGGAIALHLAERFPPDRLVLIAPLWKLMGGDWKVELLPIAKHLVRRIKPFSSADLDDPGIRKFFAGAMPDLDLDDPDVQDAIRNDIAISLETLDELRRVASHGGRIASRLALPTLVIQGTDDESVRAVDTRELVKSMAPDVLFQELAGGHMLVSDDEPSWPSVRRLVSQFVIGETS